MRSILESCWYHPLLDCGSQCNLRSTSQVMCVAAARALGIEGVTIYIRVRSYRYMICVYLIRGYHQKIIRVHWFKRNTIQYTREQEAANPCYPEFQTETVLKNIYIDFNRGNRPIYYAAAPLDLQKEQKSTDVEAVSSSPYSNTNNICCLGSAKPQRRT